jgi:hypothetical protein
MTWNTDLRFCFSGLVRLGWRVQIGVFINPNIEALITLSLYICEAALVNSG